MWRPLGPTSRATSSASMACSTCRPVPTARASRPSRAAPASSATATLTCSGSWSLAWSVLVVGWVSFGTAVPFWSSVLADARHLPHGRSQAGTATSTSTGTGTTSVRLIYPREQSRLVRADQYDAHQPGDLAVEGPKVGGA